MALVLLDHNYFCHLILSDLAVINIIIIIFIRKATCLATLPHAQCLCKRKHLLKLNQLGTMAQRAEYILFSLYFRLHLMPFLSPTLVVALKIFIHGHFKGIYEFK